MHKKKIQNQFKLKWNISLRKVFVDLNINKAKVNNSCIHIKQIVLTSLIVNINLKFVAKWSFYNTFYRRCKLIVWKGSRSKCEVDPVSDQQMSSKN